MIWDEALSLCLLIKTHLTPSQNIKLVTVKGTNLKASAADDVFGNKNQGLAVSRLIVYSLLKTPPLAQTPGVGQVEIQIVKVLHFSLSAGTL